MTIMVIRLDSDAGKASVIQYEGHKPNVLVSLNENAAELALPIITFVQDYIRDRDERASESGPDTHD